MRKTKRKLKIIGIVLLLIIAAFFAGQFYKNSSNETTITSDILNNRIESIRELATLKYHYTNMGQFENT